MLLSPIVKFTTLCGWGRSLTTPVRTEHALPPRASSLGIYEEILHYVRERIGEAERR